MLWTSPAFSKQQTNFTIKKQTRNLDCRNLYWPVVSDTKSYLLLKALKFQNTQITFMQEMYQIL